MYIVISSNLVTLNLTNMLSEAKESFNKCNTECTLYEMHGTRRTPLYHKSGATMSLEERYREAYGNRG